MDKKQLETSLLTGCIFGSRSHGTALSRSDVDIRGVYGLSYDDALSPFSSTESISLEGDVMFFEAKHFASMVASCNPNILEILWSPDDSVIHEHPAWAIFKEKRTDMLSTRVADTYEGYAHGEMKRLQKLLGLSEVDSETEYKMRKSAAHILRLLRMASEALRGEGLIVRRPDREELIAIKKGLVPIEKVLIEARELKEQIPHLAAISSLPREIPEETIRKTFASTMRKFWSMPPATAQGMMLKVLNLPSIVMHETPERLGRAIIIDIEGSGHTGQGVMDIVEIGCLETFNGKSTGKSFHALIKPELKPTSHVRRLHGITWNDVKSAPELKDVIVSIMEFVGDSPFVAHDAHSDRKMLFDDMRKDGINIPENDWYCTARLMKGILFGKKPIKHNLPSLNKTCDLMNVGRELRIERKHSALLDAQLTGLALEAMLKDVIPEHCEWKLRPIKEPSKSVTWNYSFCEDSIGVTNGMVSYSIPIPVFPDTHIIKFENNRIVVQDEQTKEISNPDGPCIIYQKRTGEHVALSWVNGELKNHLWNNDIFNTFQPV